MMFYLNISNHFYIQEHTGWFLLMISLVDFSCVTLTPIHWHWTPAPSTIFNHSFISLIPNVCFSQIGIEMFAMSRKVKNSKKQFKVYEMMHPREFCVENSHYKDIMIWFYITVESIVLHPIEKHRDIHTIAILSHFWTCLNSGWRSQKNCSPRALNVWSLTRRKLGRR